LASADITYINTEHKTDPAKLATTATSSTKSTSPGINRTTTTTNPYSGWKTYTLGQFSFKYPSDWTVTDNSNFKYSDGTEDDLTIQSSPFSTTAASSDGAPIYFIINFSKTNTDINQFCTPDISCKVTEVETLNNPALAGDKLTLWNYTDSSTQIIPAIAVTTSNTRIGDTSVSGAPANGDSRYTFVYLNYNLPNSQSQPGIPAITNPSEFVSSSSYQELIELINSVNYK